MCIYNNYSHYRAAIKYTYHLQLYLSSTHKYHLLSGLAVSSAKRKLPEETAEEMEGKKHFLPWKKWKKRKK